MDSQAKDGPQIPAGKRRRRWLLGLEPIFEGGRLHRGKRAQSWDVEEELIAVAVFGDVTIDLSQNKSAPTEIAINAYAFLRDVDVLVAENTHVELSGRANNDHLRNNVAPVPEELRDRVIQIHGHTVLGAVTVRIAHRHQ